jgi:hypothetical protein
MLVKDRALKTDAQSWRAIDVWDGLRSLHLPLERLSLRDLERVVRSIASRPHLYEDLVNVSVETRSSLRLLSMGNFEVRLQSWEHGSNSGWHDHGGSSGALAVTAGELSEVFRRPESTKTGSRAHVPGQIASFGPSHLHEVTYVAGTPAVSVHAYSPPLEKMTHYDRTTHGFIVTEKVLEECRSTVPLP